MSRNAIYLDHAASTPLRSEVFEAMEPHLRQAYANPSGAHREARAARRAVDDAREELSDVLGCSPSEVLFTSGGTESDNLAVTGAALGALASGAESVAVCCSAVEHPAVREPVRFLGGIVLPVDSSGLVDLDAIVPSFEATASGVAVVSVMLANNETGVIEPLEDVAGIVSAIEPGALVHTDAVQAARWLDLAEAARAADLISLSAHKLGGPKGVGALVVRERARPLLAPLLRGGPQERELRAGTQNVPGIVGMARAAALAAEERETAEARVTEIRERLLAGLEDRVGPVSVAGDKAERLCSILNVGFPGIVGEELLFLLDEAGVAVSAGSSCASGAIEPSPVLSAMGLLPEEAKSHLRFSFGPETTPDDADAALEIVASAVSSLRA